MTQLKITDTTLRDAHQSLAATRMRTEDMLSLAAEMEKAGFWSVEAWGGATFDTCIRYLNDDPWQRLRDLREIFVKTPIQMLLRGQIHLRRSQKRRWCIPRIRCTKRYPQHAAFDAGSHRQRLSPPGHNIIYHKPCPLHCRLR